jgi:hypothetical protein
MPDLTRAEAAKLDAYRKVYASMARLWALQSELGDAIGWRPVIMNGAPDGRIHRNWFIEDRYDEATIKIAEIAPTEEDELERIGAFGYVRNYLKKTDIYVYTFTKEPDIAIIGSQRVWTFFVTKSHQRILLFQP